MTTDIPKHILAQIGFLGAEGRSIAEIAFLLRLDESVVADWLTTTSKERSGKPIRSRSTKR